MPQHGKRYRAAEALREPGRIHEIAEAVQVLAGFPKSKFDETVEVNLCLGIDPKKSDQMVRGSISLPHGIGKELRVVVFAEGDKAEEARAAGALEVGSQDLAQKIQGGWTDFDVSIATPDMMRHVGKLGKILEPQGKMPSPKAGTVTMDVGKAVREFRAGKIEFRNDEGGNLGAPMGRRSFSTTQLQENIEAFISYVGTLKPQAAKGTFISKGTIAATHTPGIRIRV